MTAPSHRIQTLSDTNAQRILTIFARNQPGYSDSTLSPELTKALQHEPDLMATAASSGDLARAALLLLADDPQHRPMIDAMVSQPPVQRFALAETAAIMGAVLFVLGTHIKVERNAKGTWTFKVEKQPTDPTLLKALMEKLLGFARKDRESRQDV
jgi:hypothetical protein